MKLYREKESVFVLESSFCFFAVNRIGLMDRSPETVSVVHMKEGIDGESYARNSSVQNKATESMKHVIVEAGVASYRRMMIGSSSSCRPETTMVMADLGCATGPNALSLLRDIVNAISGNRKAEDDRNLEFMVFLNDLPSNDFNSTFASFPSEYFTSKKIITNDFHDHQMFLAGVPGSFYSRLFPRDTLHFIYSCYSLHWLSRVPPDLVDSQGRHLNIGKIYISRKTSPPAVAKAYAQQFRIDFMSFLKLRSVELVHGGRMAFLMAGRKKDNDHHHHHHGHEVIDDDDDCTSFLWECLADSFAILVARGELSEENVNGYNVPYYEACTQEIEECVEEEGSFKIEYLEVTDFSILSNSGGDAVEAAAETVSMGMRATLGPMLSIHFGDQIVDRLFAFLADMIMPRIKSQKGLGKSAHLSVVLEK